LQDIENLQKHAELFLLDMRAAHRRFALIGWLNKIFCRIDSDLRSPISGEAACSQHR
jgi:hypothetical protein